VAEFDSSDEELVQQAHHLAQLNAGVPPADYWRTAVHPSNFQRGFTRHDYLSTRAPWLDGRTLDYKVHA
jgi:hypothetical protein